MQDVSAEPRASGAPSFERLPFTQALVSRAVWAFFFGAPLLVFGIAALLTPDPAGHGTHTQLGLPPCGMIVLTGIPCPGCGLTTCFAHMVRGEVIDAARANPFGVMLFLFSAAVAGLSAVGFVRGWAILPTLDRFHADKWAILLAVSSLTVWIVRVVTMFATA